MPPRRLLVVREAKNHHTKCFEVKYITNFLYLLEQLFSVQVFICLRILVFVSFYKICAKKQNIFIYNKNINFNFESFKYHDKEESFISSLQTTGSYGEDV